MPGDSGGSYQDDGEGKPATVEELANQILLCQTWVTVAEAVNRDGDKLIKVASEQMSLEQRQGLTTLLATHLCENPADLDQIAWIPAKLRDKALGRLRSCLKSGFARLEVSREYSFANEPTRLRY